MNITQMVQHPLDIRIHEVPGTHVFRLLLAPDDLGELEAAKFLDQRAGREGIKLLDAQQIDIVALLRVTGIEQVI